MSSLSALVPYSSDEEENIVEKNPQKASLRKVQLPKPKLSQVNVTLQEEYRDNPDDHDGRVRNFPHERGNWPTYVYAPCLCREYIDKFVADVKECCHLDVWKSCEDLHVSLSRTIGLRYHWINTFTSTVQESLRNIESFEIEFASVKVYCNDDSTRTFIALAVDCFSSRDLNKITSKIDSALKDFKLPKYYEKPSFHVSVLWCSGNKLLQLEKIEQELQNKFEQYKKNLTFVLDSVVCKCGNKTFQFPLKY